MKQLFLGEIKKIFSQKIVLYFVGILLIVNIFNAYESVVNSSDYWIVEKARNGIYAIVQGKITEESVEKIISYRDKMEEAERTGEKVETFFENPGTDLLHVNNIIRELTSVYNYNNRITQLKENIKCQREVLKEKNNPYLAKINEKIDKTYSQRQITCFYNTKGFEAYFDYDFSTFLILLITILACSSAFSSEKENGMSKLMLSAVNGRTKMASAKKLSCVIFIISVSLLFFISDYLIFYFTTSMKGLGLPLYALRGYEYTPLTISIGSFMLLMIIIRIIGLIYIGFIICTFSSSLSKSYTVFAFGLATTFILMYIASYSNSNAMFINLINPIKLLTGRNMFKTFDVINVSGNPFDRYVVVMILSFSVIIALSIFITNLNRKGQKRRSKNEIVQTGKL